MEKSFLRFMCLSLVPGILSAFPQSPQVVFGDASFSQQSPEKIIIETSDRAIINYEEFNVGEKEIVEFIQKSASSTVLNRVVGKSPSEILGNIKSNGAVFLVNPYGVYFGPTSVVDTGSLVVSTLDIADVDFINEKFSFKAGSFTGSIENKGLLSASNGSIALLSPQIKNDGIIEASAEKVVFASGEAITLTFEGNQLMSFAVEDEASHGLIEHLGSAQSKQVFLQVGAAKQAIERVINHDGIVEGLRLIKENGRVRIAGGVKAQDVYVESPSVLVEGNIDVTSSQKGGEVHLLGDHLELSGALIDASGDLGGGRVLIGGEYKGGGPFRNAITNQFDETSVVRADALQTGDGGRVIVWADGITIYNGYISVDGGKLSGDGGFIETSGQYDLRVGTGRISALASNGKLGSWLLDPTTLTIVSGSSGTLPIADCLDATNPSIGTTTIDAVAGNVILCATSTITQNIGADIQMNTLGASLSFTTATTVTLNANIQTTGGDVSFTPAVVLGSGITSYSIDTTFNSTAAGASVSFNSTLNGTTAGTRSLTVNGGTGGTVTFTGAVGGTTALANLSATGATVTQGSTVRTSAGGAVSYTAPTAINLQGNILTALGEVTLTGPVTISNTPSIDTTNSGGSSLGANISYSGTINGATSLGSTSGTTGTVTFSGVVGGSAPPTNLTFGSCNSVRITTDITMSGANQLNIGRPVVLLGPVNITTNNNAVNFTSGVNGAFALTLTTGSGGGLFSGVAVGGTTPLASLSVIATSPGFFQQNIGVTTTGTVTYSTPNSPSMSVSGNITTSGSAILFNGPVGINGTSTFDTTSGSAAGSNITFQGALSGSSPLTLKGGTSGTVAFNSTVTMAGASGTLTVSSAGIINQTSTLTAAAAISYTAGTAINIQGNITTNAGSVTFAGPVVFTGARIITTNNGTPTGAAINFSDSTTTLNFSTSNTIQFIAGTAGQVSFNGVVGTTIATAPTNMTFTSSGGIRIGANITVTGANTLTFTQAVTMIGTSTIDSNNANIGFNNTLNGAFDLTITGGLGTTTFTGVVGGTTPLTSLSVTSAAISQVTTVTTGSGGVSYTGSLTSTGNITTNSGPITFTGPVSFGLGKTLTTNNTGSGAAITFSGSTSTINFTTVNNLVFAAGTGIVSFGGIIGGTQGPNNLSFTSSGGIQIGANITVTTSATFGQAVTLTAPSTISMGNGTVTFSSTLDGAQALIIAGGSGTTTFTGAVGSITPLSSIVVTCATITQSSSMVLTGGHVYIGSTVSNVSGDITTSGGALSFTGPVTFSGARTFTTAGGGIVFTGSATTLNFSGNNTLAFAAGSGVIVFGGNVGTPNAPSNLIFTSSGGILIAANVTVTGANPLQFLQAVGLTGASTITMNSGNNIIFGSTLDGAQDLTLVAGSGTIAFSGAVGGTAPPTNLIFTSSGGIQIGANMTVSGANELTFPQAVTMTGTSTITSNSANITFSTTLEGAQALTIAGGTGTTTFTGAVGGTPLSSLSVTSRVINQNSTAAVTGALSYTGSSATNISGDITTSGGIVTMTGPVFLTGALTFDTTNSASIGANINFSGSTSTVNFSTSNSLILAAGTGGNVIFGAAVGNAIAPTILNVTSASSIQVASNITVSGSNALAFTRPVLFTGASTITTNSANLSFSNTLNGGQAVTFVAGTGTIAFSGIVGDSAPPTNLIFTSSGGIQIGASITVSGDNTLSFSQAVSLTGTSSLTSTNANISFASTLDGAQILTFVAGTGTVAFSGVVGSVAPPLNLVFTSSGGIQVGASITVSSANPLIFGQAVSLTGTSTITSNGASIGFNSTLNGAQTLTIAGGAGTTTFTGAVGGVTPLTSLLVTSATITQTSTAQTTGTLRYTGTSAININGDITTSGGLILMVGPVTFTGARTLTTNSSPSVGANISFFGSTSTVNFTTSNTLTFLAGTGGIISFSGIVGAGTAPTNLIFTSANTIQVGADITVTGDNTLSFPFPVSLTGSPTFTSNGANINFGSTLNGAQAATFAAGGGTVAFSGVVGGVTPPTNLVFSSSAGILVGANITVSGDNALTFGQAVSLTGASIITSNDANISFSTTLNGSRDLTLAAGVGTVTFTGAVGAVTPLASLSVTDGTLLQSSTMAVTGALSYTNSLQGTISGTISAGSITVSGAGTTLFEANPTATSTFVATSPITFNTSLTLTAPSGITLFTAIPTSDGVYDLTLNASGGTLSAEQLGSPTEYINILTLSATYFDIGAIYANNISNLILADIVAPGSNLVFSFPTTVESGTFTINVTGGSSAGSVTFQSTLDGPGGLTFILGTGDLAFDGVVGGTTPLGDMTVASAGNVDIADSFTSRSFIQTSGSGTTTLSGAMSVSSSLGISMTGNIFVMNGSLTTASGPIAFNNVGLLTLAAAVDSSGSFSQTAAGPVSLGANIVSIGDQLFTGPVTLTANVVLDSSVGSGAITFESTATINGAHSLTFVAGTGTVSVLGAVGGTSTLTTLAFTSAGLIEIGSNITVTSALSFPAAVELLGTSTITSNNTNVTFGSTIDGTYSLTLVCGSGTATFTGAVGDAPLAELVVSAASIVQSDAVLTIGRVSYTAASISIGGDITTSRGNITMTGPVTLTNDATFDTTDTMRQLFGADITFTSTLNGAYSLTLDAGTAGTILFSANVGAVAALTNLAFTGAKQIQIAGNVTVSGANTLEFAAPVSITGASTITSNGESITFDSTVDGTHALTIAGGAGTTTFSGAVGSTQRPTSVSVTSTNIVQSGALSSSGTVTYSSSGTVTVDGYTTAGAFTESGAATVSLGASIIVTSAITIAGAITFDESISLTASGSGGITVSTITPTISGAYNLTLSALGGVITATQLGSSSAYIDVLNLAAKALNVGSIYANTIIDNGALAISSNIVAPGAYLVFPNPTTVASGTYTIDVTGGTAPGKVSFSSTLDGPGSLLFMVGGGNLSFDGFIGSIVAFGDLAIDSAQNVTVSKTFTGSSFTQAAGGGTTKIAGAMTTTSVAGVSLTGTIMNITGPILTSSAGPVAFDNTGLLTIDGNITSNGPVSQTGGGTVALGSTIMLTNATAADAAVSFDDPITLIDEVVINTSIGGGNISFGSSSTINGLKELALIAGSGDISLAGAVGSVTPLDAFTIYSADSVTLAAFESSSFSQVEGSGTTTIGGSMKTTGSSGISIVGNIINVNANIETLGKGPVILQNSGLLTISTGVEINAAGEFLQTGTGDTSISGNVTAHW